MPLKIAIYCTVVFFTYRICGVPLRNLLNTVENTSVVSGNYKDANVGGAL